MATVKAHVTIKGTRPLLWNHFSPDAIPLQAREKTGKAGHDPSEWKRSVLKTSDGQLYLEPSSVFGCVRDGAKFTRQKRGTLQPLVAATVQVADERVLVDRFMPAEVEALRESHAAPVYLDVRSVRNPATRARNVRCRVAASKGWTAVFSLVWDNTVVGEAEMECVLHDAGRLVGLGDGRGIGFGRFEVVTFTLEGKGGAKKETAKRGVGDHAKKGVAA
jgi:hypothetical protein